MILAQPTNLSIADYCAAMDRGEITVNRSYQRSDKVWPVSAKSYLIESILLGYPVPKFYLYSITDAKNRKTIKEIVDGQQRSNTIHEFLNDKFALAVSLDTEELRGLLYSTMDEDWQGKFLSYLLSIDQFVGADGAEVRQVFRRMNSYTVPLNPEELRHADNQGLFKWFVSRIASGHSDILLNYGIFSDKSIVRMQDLKLITEIAHAIDSGVSTTARVQLDKLYKKYDAAFPNESAMQADFEFAFNLIDTMSFLKGTNLAKAYQIYSLALALIAERHEYMNTHQNAQPNLDMLQLEASLLDMSAALDTPTDAISSSPYKNFIEASADRTNVKDQRQRRIEAYRTAVKGAIVELA